jgi:hypothetical protein
MWLSQRAVTINHNPILPSERTHRFNEHGKSADHTSAVRLRLTVKTYPKIYGEAVPRRRGVASISNMKAPGKPEAFRDVLRQSRQGSVDD